MTVYEVPQDTSSIGDLRQSQRPDPGDPAPGQVLVRLRAASLNYRDLMIAKGTYGRAGLARDTVPLSDGAGEVVAVGDGVTEFAVGDRVAGTFFQPTSGVPSAEEKPLGAPLDGVLQESRLFYEAGLVHAPAGYSFEEAATLPCAAVTAWHALMEAGAPVRPGQTVLALGTGGVSTFALQFAAAAGARVIVTSSSDAKLETVRGLGADLTVNYKETPDWAEAVLDLTDGHGADAIIEVGGVGTLGKSFKAVAKGGKIGLIGVLADADDSPAPYPLMGKGAALHGIFVGDRPMFQAMNRAIEANQIKPVIDRVFPFEEASAAYRYLAEADHTGKVVVSI